jgi:diketogulonate reductase-like aldo/keto reductase
MTLLDPTSLPTASLGLNTGAKIPFVGLGVWQSPAGRTTRNAVAAALRLGYRHIDTAAVYGNEADVGKAIRESGIVRESLFITTKLWNADQGFDRALHAFDNSLEKLGLNYVDLYLIHWPVKGKRLDSYRALERIAKDGRARAIGVSNYLVPHLEELLAHAELVPAVNQIELHPFLQRRETCDFCARHGIVVEAYSPLTHGERLDDPVVGDVARALGRTPAQVLLRWAVQHELVVLPKSVREARIAENGALFDFEIDAGNMQRLDALEEGFATCWDPADQP